MNKRLLRWALHAAIGLGFVLFGAHKCRAGAVSIPGTAYDWEIWHNGTMYANKSGSAPQGSNKEFGTWSGLHTVKIFGAVGSLTKTFSSACGTSASNWYISYSGSNPTYAESWTSGCGAEPASNPDVITYKSYSSYTNVGFATQLVTVLVTYGSNQAPSTFTTTVEPGQSFSNIITSTNSFVFTIRGAGFGTDGYNESLQLGLGTASSTTSTNVPAQTGSLGPTVDGDVFGGVPAVPPTWNPVVGSTNLTRGTGFSTEVLAIATLDANNNQRQQEMVSVMLNLEKEKWRRDAGVTLAQAESAARIQKEVANLGGAVATVGTKVDGVKDAVNSLGSSLTNGTGSSLGGRTNVGTGIYSAAGTLSSGIPPTLPTITTDSTAFVIPLGSLGVAGLSNQSWNFAGGDLSTVRGIMRTVLLSLVTLAFLISTYRLTGRIAGV